jgi:hypothetical protein
MSCQRAGALLPLHVAGDLPARQAQSVARHLAACTDCRGAADEYAASRAWMQTGAQPVFTDEFYADMRGAVLQRIRQEQRPAHYFAPRRTPRLAYVAAVLALVSVLGALAWRAQVKRTSSKALALVEQSKPRVPSPAPTPVNAPPPAHSAVSEQPHATIAERRRPRRGAAAVRVDHSWPAPLEAVARTTQTASLPPPAAPAEPGRAAHGAETARIEMQTADPNIRIIWLAPEPAAVQPDRERR